MPKKSAPKSAPQDWHRADIKCALDKKSSSMAHLSRTNGYSSGSLRIALRMPWPKAEAIIAAKIGVAPQSIWPSRYRPDGSPKSRRGERGLGRIKPRTASPEPNKQYSECTDGCNVKDQSVDRHTKSRKAA